MTAVLTGIVAFVRAIPAIQQMFNQLVNLYLNSMDAKTEAFFAGEKEGRNYAIKKIKVADSDAGIVDGFNDLIK